LERANQRPSPCTTRKRERPDPPKSLQTLRHSLSAIARRQGIRSKPLKLSGLPCGPSFATPGERPPRRDQRWMQRCDENPSASVSSVVHAPGRARLPGYAGVASRRAHRSQRPLPDARRALHRTAHARREGTGSRGGPADDARSVAGASRRSGRAGGPPCRPRPQRFQTQNGTCRPRPRQRQRTARIASRSHLPRTSFRPEAPGHGIGAYRLAALSIDNQLFGRLVERRCYRRDGTYNGV
jgi:hypothetical protein